MSNAPYQQLGGGNPFANDPSPYSEKHGIAHSHEGYEQHHGHSGGHIQQHQAQSSSCFGGCRDIFFSLIFLVHLIGMITLSIICLKEYRKDLVQQDDGNDANGKEEDGTSTISLNNHALSLFFMFIGLGLVTSLIALEMFKRFARLLIYVSLIFTPLWCFLLAFVAFTYIHNIAMGVVCIIFGLLNFLYIWLVRHRIEFSANILSIVSQVLQAYPATTFFAFVCAILEFVWLLVWLVAAAGSMHYLKKQEKINDDGTKSEPTDGQYAGVWFLLLLSFYWTLQVVKNVCHVTVAGLVGTWYFSAPQMPDNPTFASFRRATWSSFGSICLGSLVIAFVKALRGICEVGRNAEHPIARCLVLCILGCLEKAIEYFNQYAFTQVAIYGKSYCAAAKDTMKMLKSTIVYALINDNLIGSVCFFAALINALFGFALGAIGAKFWFDLSYWALWGLIGALVSFGISMIVMEVVESSVIAFFVCWSEDPQRLYQTKIDVYNSMTDSLAIHKQKRPTVYVGQPQAGQV